MAELNNRCGCCFAPKSGSGVCPHCGCEEGAQNAAHQLPIGTVLKEQYQIGKVLGQGGFGITYLGWDLYLDTPVAVKEYYPGGMVMREAAVTLNVTDTSGDDGIRFRNNRDRFMREAKMLARFSQVPEVVQVRNFFLSNNTAYIVMEYVEGITLKQYVREQGGRLTVEKTLSLLGPVIQTLSKVHKTGIVHRDISPDNIMLLPSGGVKLLDFGAVRDVSGSEVGKELTKSTEAILKQGYAPIEQYQKKGSLGPWTDVYALCATICFCLTGEVPPDAPARMLDYEDVDLASIADLSPHQRQALEHGMALRADMRTPSMEQLYEELFRFSPIPEPEPKPDPDPKPEPDPKPDPEPVPKPDPKPVPWKKLVLVLVLVAVVAAAALFLLTGRREDPQPVPTEPVTTAGPEILHTSQIPDSELSWTLYSDGNLVITGNGSIPDGGDSWSDYRDQIRSVILDGEITDIGAGAFADCTGLGDIQLPDSLERIGDGAFRNTGLHQITLPERVQFVGNAAFADCVQLTSVTIGGNTRLCYDWTNDVGAVPIFCGTNGDVSAITLKGLSGGIVEDYAGIYGYAFEPTEKTDYELRGAISHEFADIIWSFDAQTGFLQFDGTGWLDTYGGSHRYGGSFAHANDREIPWADIREQVLVVSIADGITGGIHPNTFENHVNLDDVYIGKGITNIGQYAFANTAIDWLHLPDNITGLEAYAFDHCSKLFHVSTPMSMHGVYKSVFNQCLNIREFYTMGWLEDTANHRNTPFTSLEKNELEMPQNMVIYTVGRYAHADEFGSALGIPVRQGVDGRQAVLMGAAGTRVAWMLEDGVLTLFGYGDTGFYHSDANMANAWNDRVSQAFDSEDAEFYPYREEIEHIVIQPGVTRLNKYIFADMPNLKSIDFGTVEALYSEAIVNCGMEMLVMPDTIHTILDRAVVDCGNLKYVHIYNAEKQLGNRVFDGCSALHDVTFYANAQPPRQFLAGMEHVTIHAGENAPASIYARENGIPQANLMIVG